MHPVKIILADDHCLLRHGIKRLIQEDPAFLIIDEARDGLELLQELEQERPDLVIMDINMPKLQGLKATEFIKRRYPAVKVLILTLHGEKHYLQHAMEAGADGYVLKEDMDRDLHAAIKAVLEGRSFYISPRASGFMV